MSEQQPLNAFCAYTQEDQSLWEELRYHLSVLRRQGLIVDWYTWKFDGKMGLEEVGKALSSAQVILLFINSQSPFEYLLSDELEEVVKRSEEGTALVFPILSGNEGIYTLDRRSILLFNQLTFFPSEAKALTSWVDRDDALSAQTRYILSFARSYQAVESLPEDQMQRLEMLGRFEREAREKALSKWSEYQIWDKERETSQSLNNLAALYHSQGKYSEAEALYRQALSIAEKAYGLEHLEVATDLNNLATLYQAQGRHREAEPLFQRALTIREQALGPEHPTTAQSIRQLALICEQLQQYGKAELWYLRAFSIYKQTLGETHPDTQNIWQQYVSLLRTMGQEESSMEPETNDSDQELVQRVQLGDQEAFTLLFHRYNEPICRYIFYMVRNSDDMQDIAQQTFEKAYRQLPLLEGRTPFKGWLYTIAKNITRDYLRVKQRKLGLPPKVSPQEDEEKVSAMMEERTIQAELIELAWGEAREKLTPTQMQCFIWDLEGVKREEIARRLNLSKTTVETYLSKAYLLFRQTYQGFQSSLEEE